MSMEIKTESTHAPVHVRFNHEKHTCPMCCLEHWNVPPSFFEGEFSQANILANGSIIPVVPITCNTCGIKVIP